MNKLWDKLDIEIRNANIVTTWDVLSQWTKLGYKEKIPILMDEWERCTSEFVMKKFHHQY